MKRMRAAREDGFTLVELLIVIVVLGILAGIVVFAVGGLRGDATGASCATDKKAVETALEAYNAQTGGYPSSLAVLGGTGGALKGAVITGNDLTTDEYTVTWDPAAKTVTCDVPLTTAGGGGSTGGATTGGATTGGATTGGATTGGGPVDSVSPTTTAAITAGTPGQNGWRRSAVTLTLTATDAGTPTSGVSSLTYRMTGATTQPAQTVNASTAAPAISADGTTTVFFRATDTAGNAETEKSFVVKIDQTPPSGLSLVRVAGGDPRQPQFSGFGSHSSGPSADDATVTVKVFEAGDPVPVRTYAPTVDGGTGAWGPTAFGNGNLSNKASFTAQVEQSDAAGNSSTSLPISWSS